MYTWPDATWGSRVSSWCLSLRRGEGDEPHEDEELRRLLFFFHACVNACVSLRVTVFEIQSAICDAYGPCVVDLNGSVNGACASGPRHDSLSESGEICNDSNTQCIPLRARAPPFLKQ